MFGSIVDASKSKKKVKTPYSSCEGQCLAWLHRQCAGLSKALFDYCTKSDNPFQCPHCTLQEHALEIAKLKEAIESLTKSVSTVKEISEKPVQAHVN